MKKEIEFTIEPLRLVYRKGRSVGNRCHLGKIFKREEKKQALLRSMGLTEQERQVLLKKAQEEDMNKCINTKIQKCINTKHKLNIN